MSLKENYLNEINLLKNERIQRVVEAAKVEFSVNGIKNSKLRVIAKRAKVGEASIYRYFKDKDDLIKIVALSHWQNHANIFDDYYYGQVLIKDTGIRKVESALNIFQLLYKNNKDFLKFVEEYDNYYSNEELDSSISSVQHILHEIKRKIVIIFNEGINDGTINSVVDAEEKFDFMFDVMFATTQKLIVNTGKKIGHDQEYAEKCISDLVSMFIKYIKN